MAIKIIPFIWLSVVSLVLITHKPAGLLTSLIVEKEDSFGAQITLNILCTVFLMFIFMTLIGGWIGAGQIRLDHIQTFFLKWPRNFTISLAVELLLAQPIARLMILKWHHLKDKNEEYRQCVDL